MIFVLWGTYCYENVATTFVTEMRTVGLMVKVVGLGNRQLVGAHGVVLVPDLTLGQALPLAKKASCVVIPCDVQTFQKFHNDPRLQKFIACASANHAHFVVREEQIAESIYKNSPARNVVSIYPLNQKLVSFAQAFALSLQTG